MHIEHLEISRRFCGPPDSGNGGYVCGRIAKGMSGTISVRLRAPPPLETPLRREWSEDTARLLHGTTVIAEARVSAKVLGSPAPISLAHAKHAAENYPGFKSHVFPRCFVCGPARTPGDGLRIFPGPIEGSALHAAPWMPEDSLADEDGLIEPEFLWAALDCPSGFAVLPMPEGQAIVLGEMCVSVRGCLWKGQAAVVSAWPVSRKGRRREAASAIHSEAGSLIAIASATWIEVPASQWTSSS